ncbi:MAG: hypothetical protein SAK29_01345 [Scytonema sp. PMC 1069.18]|nr:hypothetical protein [Scytonema sp. PMC 1069.18]MEC4880163.1 hypothetical protein [Scytonema sp. PMC 1070.18]
MPQISDFLDAARTIRPLLPTLVDTETAQLIDQQLASTLNQSTTDDRTTAKAIRDILQSYPATQAWLTEFLKTEPTQRSFQSLSGDPLLKSATKYICPIGNDYTRYREANEEIPLCPTHLVPLVPAPA